MQVIDFALVVLRLLMFKVCVITAISKIVFFFNFSCTERAKSAYFVEYRMMATSAISSKIKIATPNKLLVLVKKF